MTSSNMEEEEVGEASLTMLAERTLQSPINLKHLAYCPTMSLLALATDDEQVHVFRTNGQRVFGITRKNPASKITGIKWKPDGTHPISISTLPAWTTDLVIRSISCRCF